MHINGATQMMQAAGMGVVPGAMPVQGPGQGPVPVGQGPVQVGPPGKLHTAMHTMLTSAFLTPFARKLTISISISVTNYQFKMNTTISQNWDRVIYGFPLD